MPRKTGPKTKKIEATGSVVLPRLFGYYRYRPTPDEQCELTRRGLLFPPHHAVCHRMAESVTLPHF